MLGVLEGHSPRPSSDALSASTRFQVRLLDALTLGPLMALHSSFAYIARESPRFYFSRKICFEAAWGIASRSLPRATSPSDARASDMYDGLLLHASGLFERVQVQASAHICMEMLNSYVEKSFLSNALFDSEVVFVAIRHSIDLCARRLGNESTDVAVHVILSCALAHVRALESKSDPQALVAEAAVRSLKECSQMLQSVAEDSIPQTNVVIQDLDSSAALDPGGFDEDWTDWLGGLDPLDLAIPSSSWWTGDDVSLLNNMTTQQSINSQLG
jgi:hypothetical protein